MNVQQISEPLSPQLYHDFLTALLAGDRRQCIEIVEDLLHNACPVRVLYLDLFQRSMYRVGELWERNCISVANEHLATSLVESLFSLVYPYLFAIERKDRNAIICCVMNEYHQIGARMVADTFELHGWNGYLLGANTPIPGLLRFIDEKRPELVGFSLSLHQHSLELLLMLKAVRSAYPELPILLGGQGIGTEVLEATQHDEQVTYISSLVGLEEWIDDA